MANVTKNLRFGTTDYLVGNGLIQISVRFDDNQDWSIGNNITADIISVVDFSDTDHPAVITDYSVLYKKLKGGLPVFVNVTGPTTQYYLVNCSVTPFVPGPGAPCQIQMNNVLIYTTGNFTHIYRKFNCAIMLNSNGTYHIDMISMGESTDIIASNALKPIIIKTAVISGDPAINTIVPLTISEAYDTAKGTIVLANRLFDKGTYGRRLVVYILGAGSTLIPCELLPVYSTDYTTPALFSGFTGIKFRGSDRTNYYGFYVKLANDGTLTATVEDRQVYS